jgi:MFS family permease
MSGAGAAVGLIAGGLLTEIDWRWVFFVNVPFGLVIAWAAPRVLGESTPETGRIDVVGAITGTAGLTVLVYGITRAGNPATGWTDPLTLVCFAVALVLLVVFLVIESRTEQPILPLHLFAERNRSASYLVMFVVGGALFSSFYFISLFVQLILQYTPVQAGLAFLPFTGGIVVGAGIGSQLAPRLPPRVITGVGLAMASVGMFLYSRLDSTSTYVSGLLAPLLIISVGMGLAFVSLTLTAVSGVPNNESGIASGVLNTMQQVGGSLGLAALATVAATATTAQFAQADAVGAQLQAVANGVPGVAPPDPALVVQWAESLTHGYATAFGVGTIMMVVALVLTLVLVNAPKQAPVAGAPAHIAG